MIRWIIRIIGIIAISIPVQDVEREGVGWLICVTLFILVTIKSKPLDVHDPYWIEDDDRIKWM